MSKHIVGIWCGSGQKLIQGLHGKTLIEITISRAPTGICLIPLGSEFDWLEDFLAGVADIRRRCHPDERIAMRDLVVETEAGVGAIIQGDCVCIDRAEVRLALARVSSSWGEYVSPRVTCYSRDKWLGFNDDEEWGPYPAEQATLVKLRPEDLNKRWAQIQPPKG